MSDAPLPLVGAPGSPYSRKLRAVLRYRRIAYAWMHQGAPEARHLPVPRVPLLPQLVLPDASRTPQACTDTTPLIRELERRYPSSRSVIPADPVLAFVDELIEDYADEWLTKCMFHYRWAFAPDVAKAAAILPRWFRTNQPEASALAFGEQFSARQIGRLGVVGSNPTTAPLIEDAYSSLLRCLDAHLTSHRFVLGERPGACDFALYGQLTQLAQFDPTPAAITLRTAPRVVAWVDVVEDLSGLQPGESDWLGREQIGAELRPLLMETGRAYPTFLLANAAALAAGAERVECEIDGRTWVQSPFPYQRKCLTWLRESRAALGADDRGAVDALLSGTGWGKLFAAEGAGPGASAR